MVVGFRNKRDVFYVKKLKELCPTVHICTDDGSFGEKGLVTNILIKHQLHKHYYFACGSNAMLQALYRASGTEGQLSLESRMGCGFGACMGCSIKTKNGYKQICKDGPVFHSKDLLW
jgi:dihydroorotate dehydrogenase electron transfer subunit